MKSSESVKNIEGEGAMYSSTASYTTYRACGTGVLTMRQGPSSPIAPIKDSTPPGALPTQFHHVRYPDAYYANMILVNSLIGYTTLILIWSRTRGKGVPAFESMQHTVAVFNALSSSLSIIHPMGDKATQSHLKIVPGASNLRFLEPDHPWVKGDAGSILKQRESGEVEKDLRNIGWGLRY
ncbi:hypothetical protein B9Z19DRAFT_1164783 [Tuber borchii]|uniref:Uncharacterized protein n=1 Tax=Tuber borchii TaxID=42251 RepID=A0A2T7A1W7_TUBBO|nr:hypothetical protein B9Z19DRAFT_1164783 [Tuber borchii]